MADAYATSFATLNYSGMLFNKGRTEVPFSTIVGNRRRVVNHVAFPIAVTYTTGGGDQPNIHEIASLTAPEATFITRGQTTNVTQIFHETVGVSYAKEANMGTMSGLNIAGQRANPPVELDFQLAARFNKIAQDIEATFLRGAYVMSAADDTANRSRGITTAITSNIEDINHRPLTIWDVAAAVGQIADSKAPVNNLILMVDQLTLFQLNADAQKNGMTIVPGNRTINGIAIDTLITPLAQVGIVLGYELPAATALLFNPSVVARVEQETPGKGNFFVEQLAKIGAGSRYQIFGQLGLDHGPEWYHAKIVNINTDFNRPRSGIEIYADDPVPVANVLPEIKKVTLPSPVELDEVTEALVVEYTGTPLEDPSLTYVWKKSATKTGTYTNITGKTTATVKLTDSDVDLGDYVRVAVTASNHAVGTVLSNPVEVTKKPDGGGD